ncbi:FAD/NAD-binding domain-containing protein [Fomitiporia mediterranea MF3/22]|uniref:FAD/NAD-binding domain-containing protein n=1 Tax=Fomitiporia mediterranea (strain MF3/22) TaxID=694068 RepID=UPI0004407365|nr:FAD/NAD-binding domain-containing protein [Fomitiporia mediterranea MF3/22]EJD00301.1 FAD/NAD-binding domain-containing protein [Fomitiporia mediterranea MF3/22]
MTLHKACYYNARHRRLSCTKAAVQNTPKTEDQPSKSPFGHVAVIGAGLTGVSTAAHCIAHNFDVTLYDKNDSVGGIWSHVNSTSGLQINSLIYRFHPGVFWREGFPKRDEILEEITRIWNEYALESRTRLKAEVVKVERAPGTGPTGEESKSKDSPSLPRRSKWLVYTRGREEPDGPFDAVVCTIGTCGEPIRVHFDGMEEFENSGGRIAHSSELDQLGTEGDGSGDMKGDNDRKDSKADTKSVSSGEGPDLGSPDVLTQAQPEEGVSYADKVKASTDSVNEIDANNHRNGRADSDSNKGKGREQGRPKPLNIKGKTIAIVGSGASGVEAAEWAVEKGAKKVFLLARDDKWIIPRNVVFDTLLAMQPFGREMPLSFIVEGLLRKFHYKDLAPDVAPQNRGLFAGTPVVNDTILHHIRSGLVEYVRCSTEHLTSKGVVCKYHGSERTVEFDADVVILATGFKRSSDEFLPKELFPPGYDRPNLYLQTFCTEDWSILLTNASYMNAIGTVGHFHIGIYTRILLTFLLDKNARPNPHDMKLWVDVLRFIKRGAPGGALGFFTYAELTFWFLSFHLFRPSRLRWIFFIMQGWGVTAEDSGRLKVE